MIWIRYKTGCRECLKAGKLPFSSNVMDQTSIDKFVDMSHYDLSRQIRRWRIKDCLGCWNCGSQNEDILDIEIDDIPVFSFQKSLNKWVKKQIPFYEINIDKSNSKITITDGGVHQMPTEYKISVVKLLIDEITKYDNGFFHEFDNGNFFGSVSGSMFNKAIDNLRFHGFTKNEIIQSLEKSIETL